MAVAPQQARRLFRARRSVMSTDLNDAGPGVRADQTAPDRTLVTAILEQENS
jgi:hypothetical protein